MIDESWPRVSDPWLAAGCEKVLLPSGTSVLFEPTTVAQLMIRDALPGYLRAMALQFAGTEGVNVDALDDGEKSKWQDLVGTFVVQSVRAVALPGDDEFRPYRLTPEQIDDTDPRMPRPDLEALQALAMHVHTPDEVTARSRLGLLHGQIRRAIDSGADEATVDALRKQADEQSVHWNRIIEREAVRGLAGWLTFRDRARGADPVPERSGVAGAPVRPADHRGPGGRVRARRRAGTAASTRRRGDRKSAEG